MFSLKLKKLDKCIDFPKVYLALLTILLISFICGMNYPNSESIFIEKMNETIEKHDLTFDDNNVLSTIVQYLVVGFLFVGTAIAILGIFIGSFLWYLSFLSLPLAILFIVFILYRFLLACGYSISFEKPKAL